MPYIQPYLQPIGYINNLTLDTHTNNDINIIIDVNRQYWYPPDPLMSLEKHFSKCRYALLNKVRFVNTG